MHIKRLQTLYYRREHTHRRHCRALGPSAAIERSGSLSSDQVTIQNKQRMLGAQQ